MKLLLSVTLNTGDILLTSTGRSVEIVELNHNGLVTFCYLDNKVELTCSIDTMLPAISGLATKLKFEKVEV